MDETLRIKNFLVLKDADISVKRVNLLIGPQANGKNKQFIRAFESERHTFPERRMKVNRSRQIQNGGMSGY